MQEMDKKRVLAKLFGMSLIVALILIFILLVIVNAFAPEKIPASEIVSLVSVFWFPVVVGGIVGACVRQDVEGSWVRARRRGMLVWWLILLAVLITLGILYTEQYVPPPPAIGYTPCGPCIVDDTALGRPNVVIGFLFLLEGVYGLCTMPLLFLGVAMTCPRRER